MKFIKDQEQEQQNEEDTSKAELWIQRKKQRSNQNKQDKIKQKETKQQSNINNNKPRNELINQKSEFQNQSDLNDTQKETLKYYLKQIKETKLIILYNKQLIQEEQQQHSNQQWEQNQYLENKLREEMKTQLINLHLHQSKRIFQFSSSFPSEVQFKYSNNQSIECMKQKASEQIIWGSQSRNESQSGIRFGQKKTEIMKFKDKSNLESFAEFKVRYQQMMKQQQQSSSSQPNESSETKPESKTKKYTPYTYSYFNNIQSHLLNLGGLGPDLENIKIMKKQKAKEKVMEFADKQMKENFEKTIIIG